MKMRCLTLTAIRTKSNVYTNNNRYKSECRNCRLFCVWCDYNVVLVLTCVWLLLVANVTSASHLNNNQFVIHSQYQIRNETVNFSHLAYDMKSNRLYVGALNNLLQLNGNDLHLEQQFSTGPIPDSVQCSASDCSQAELVQTNNVNKLILIDYFNSKLIACGSVKQGSCRRHTLNNISDAEPIVPIPIAANDEHSSTIALIVSSVRAADPSSKHLDEQSVPVMYVAATNSKLGPYRDMIPAVCTRSLETDARLFNVLEKDISEMARLDIEFHLRDYYLVNYVYAFQSSSHVYFATTQPRSESKALEELGYSSKLARLCLDDISYNTYSEITLQCLDAESKQNYPLLQAAYLVSAGFDLAQRFSINFNQQVLVGVFTRSKDHTNQPGIGSAICMYTLQSIEAKFDYNIRSCLNGSISSRNMDYIANNIVDCPTNNNNNAKDLCTETIKLNGSNPLVALSAINYPNETLTAISALATGHNTVAFVGTSNGYLKKILLSSATSAEEFEHVQIDEGNHILPDLHIDRFQQYIYVASPYKITKILIEHCQTQNTCRECLQTKNPYCGWCSLEKKCTTRSLCFNASSSINLDKFTNAQMSSSRWISIDADKCIDFQLITPHALPIQSNSSIEIVINQLPRLPSNAHYLCVFNENVSNKATLTSNGLICESPPLHTRPLIPINQDQIHIELAIRSSETKTNFLSRNYTLYDCSVHQSCSNCLTSKWQCNWCIETNQCVSSGSRCAANNLSLLNKMSDNRFARIQQIDLCPRIYVNNQILIANDVPTEIEFKLANLPSTIKPTHSLVCLIEYEQQQHQVPALLRQDTVKCQKNTYSYKNNFKTSTARLSLVWNKERLIDTVNVTLYKCDLLGSHAYKFDCSLCLAHHDLYKCNWCSGMCKHQSKLSSNCLFKTDEQIKCPFPRIDLIHPLSGPVEGGTLVVIEGSNLGSNLDEVANTITIGGVPCVPVSYNVSVRIVCKTGRASQAMQEDVLIGNRAGYTRSREKFRYEHVEIHDFWPRLGPKSGGTRFFVHGSNLNIGSNIEIFLDGAPCLVNRTLASSQQITCKTPSLDTIRSNRSFLQYNHQYHSHPQSIVNRLTLRIDNLNINKLINFTYIEDPVIKRVHPLQSPISGGRLIHVHGYNFQTIQQPFMVVYAVDTVHILNKSLCSITSDDQMTCPSPSINFNLFQLIRREEQISSSINFYDNNIRLRIGFIMDDIETIHNVASNSMMHSWLTYVQDPQLVSFLASTEYTLTTVNNLNTAIRYHNPSELLVLEGLHLKAANYDSNEYNITIGIQKCNITSLTTNQIVCSLPTQHPSPTDELGRRTSNRLPLVVVRLGKNLRFELGYLAYNGELSSAGILVNYGDGLQTGIQVTSTTNHHIHQQSKNKLFGNSLLILLLTGSMLIIVCLLCLFFLKHKNSATEREYKKIQLQMDTLENQVRYECKQAFAELQTNMTDLSKEIQTTGVPTLDHRTYVMKVFFPGVHDHPLLVNLPPSQHFYQQINAHHGSNSNTTESLHYHSTGLINNGQQPSFISTLSKSNLQQHRLPNSSTLNNATSDYISYYKSNYELAIDQFKQLLDNKSFLLLFINTLENQRTFTIKDRVNVASLITIIFMEKMDYLTAMLNILLHQFIEKSVRCSKHPQLMLRRTESVVEKMLANWLALHMYDYLKSKSGRSLFMLFSALKHQTEKGPIDECSNEARYSLCENTLLKEHVNYQQIELQIYNIPEEFNLPTNILDNYNLLDNQSNLSQKQFQKIKVNDCDTINQVKGKMLDTIYRNVSYSYRPCINDVDLEWKQVNSQHSVILQNDDSSSFEINGWRRLNTLRHYGVQNGALMRLILKPKSTIHSLDSGTNMTTAGENSSIQNSQSNSDYGTYGVNNLVSSSTLFPIKNNKNYLLNENKNQQHWHLNKPSSIQVFEHHHPTLSLVGHKTLSGHLNNLNDKIGLLTGLNSNHHHLLNLNSSNLSVSSKLNNQLNNCSITNVTNNIISSNAKNIPEIFLTRLLSTKGTVQKFIDDFLNTILTVDDQFPQAIKWLFDLLDEAAKMHGLTDPRIVHAWKCNLLPLRFWVNFIKNPDLIFDIQKTATIDSSLGIIAQLLMDVCFSDNDSRLGKDSPSNKLLFAKDLDLYRNKLKKFYDDIAASIPVTEHEMSSRLDYLSNSHMDEFDLSIALKDLYVYAAMYAQPLCEALASNSYCLSTGLLDKFKQIICTINSQSQCI